MRPRARSSRAGVTLIELLIGVAVFGTLIVAVAGVMMSAQRVTTRQDRLVSATADARLALFRIGEVLRQAAYVYPPGVTLRANSRTFTTGDEALAVLVPAGTTYCPGTTSTYCGFVYGLAPRGDFVPPLPSGGAPDELVLVEVRATALSWPEDRVPSRIGGLTNWTNADEGLLATGVDATATRLGTNVFVSSVGAVLDDDATFQTTTTVDHDSLLNGVRVTLRLERADLRDPAGSLQSLDAFARAIPRSAQPNPD